MIENLTDAMVVVREQADTIKRLREALSQRDKESPPTSSNNRSAEIAAYIEDTLSDGDNSLYVSIERSTLTEAVQLLRAVR